MAWQGSARSGSWETYSKANFMHVLCIKTSFHDLSPKAFHRVILTIRFSPGLSEVALEGLEVRGLHSGVGRPVAGLSQGVVIQKGSVQRIYSLHTIPQVSSTLS